MNYQKQQQKIKELQAQGHTTSLPFCQEQCDECEYRAEIWRELLGEEVIDNNGEVYYLKK